MDKVYNTESAKTDLFSSITRDSHGGKETKKTVAKRRRRRKRRREVVGGGFRLSEIQAVDQPDFVVPFSSAVFSISRRSIDRSRGFKRFS